MKKLITILSLLTITIPSWGRWTGTWATAPEFTGPGDMPQTEKLAGNALRQTIHVSLGGDNMRLKLSNEYSAEPVDISSIYVANPTEGFDIDKKSARYLTFNGKRNITIPAGEAVYSDPIDFHLEPLQLLSLTTNYGASTPVNATSHRGSRTSSYIMKGESKPRKKFIPSERVEHWYNISALEVDVEGKPCIAIIGNSITDGRGTTTDKQNRWTDVLSEKLNGEAGVLNLGIGGNCVLAGGLSDPAVKRFDRDILGQNGITAILIYEGINDIGWTRESEKTAAQLIETYKKFIAQAREKGLKVYGGTITQMGNTDYLTHFHEAARQTVNDWIRNSGEYDGVVDFDAVIADPSKPDTMNPDYQFDWLHPNPAGYKAMGEHAADVLSKTGFTKSER